MRLATAQATAYVVRGQDNRVVAVFWGEDAVDEARTWVEKGYRVDRVDRRLLDEA